MKEVELKQKRGRRFKQYLQRDGTITAKVFCDDVHFMKNGIYEEIDNTLVKENNCYVNKDNNYKVYFYKNTKDALMKMEKDKYYLNIKLDNCNNAEIDINNNKSKLRSSLIYKNILNNIDFKYDVSSNKVKETIILNNKNNLLEKIVFTLESNLKLILNNKEILAQDGDKNIFKFEVPYMYDSDNLENKNVNYNLFKKDNYYVLELNIDIEWLKEERKYPVYIDPTINSVVNLGGLSDTYISSNEVDINKGIHDILKCGVEKINNVDVVHRTLLKFDLPSISTGDEIISASLDLTGYLENFSQNSPKTVAIHRITEEWDELTATWANMNDKYAERIESIYTFYRSSIANGQFTKGDVIANAEITRLVKKWYNDLDNFGIMIKSIDEEYLDDNYPAFISQNHNDLGNDFSPTLSIVYKSFNGIEEYWNYIEQTFYNGVSSINTFNGNLTSVWELVSNIGNVMPISLNLIYNTNDVLLNKNVSFIKGYKLNLDQTISIVQNNQSEYLEYCDETGTLHYFYPDFSNSDGLYYDNDGLNLYIKPENDKFILSDNDGIEFVFEKNGFIYYLTEIIDTMDNKIIIVRNEINNIIQVKDENNNVINISYSNEKIIVDYLNIMTILNITNNKISSLVYQNGVVNFSYNDKELIDNIIDVNGIKINYEYYNIEPHRVKKVTQYGINNSIGDFFSLIYNCLSTTIIDYNGSITRLDFNQYGNLISENKMNDINDINDCYSSMRVYGENENKNKLLFSVNNICYVKNYLKNSSFENDETFFSSEGMMLNEIVNTCSHSGDRCLYALSTGYHQKLSQQIAVPKGSHYTFSGYFKNVSELFLILKYTDANGNIVAEQERIEPHNQFTREQISIYYDADASSDLSIDILFWGDGDNYIDDVQLEHGEVATFYNMLENCDFENDFEYWNCNVKKISDNSILPIDNFFEIVDVDNIKSLKINMIPNTISNLSKNIPISGKKDDSFYFSFWYKNEGLHNDRDVINNYVALEFIPTNIDSVEENLIQKIEFIENEELWQHFSYNFIAENDFSGIKIYLIQNNNANNLYVTNFALYKEYNANIYNYNDNGNLISVSDLNNDTLSYTYDLNNKIVNIANTDGTEINYEYDRFNNSKVLNEILPNGLAKNIKYDSLNNPVSSKLSHKFISVLNDGLYKIRCKGTNDYLRVGSEKEIIVKNNSCSNPVWFVQKIEDDYKIKFDSIEAYSLGCYYSKPYLVYDDNTNNILFNIEKNTDGSYKVKSKSNLSYLRFYNNELFFTDLIDDDVSFDFYFELIDDEFMEEKYTYTLSGKYLSSVTDTDFNTTIDVIDEETGLKNSTTKPNGFSVNYIYNDKKQVSSISCGNKNLSFNYDNNLLNEIVQGNRKYKFYYDDFLNQNKVGIGDNIILFNNIYDVKSDNILSITYGNGNVIRYDYDKFENLKTCYKMDKSYHYIYDNLQHLTSVKSDNYKIKYIYDTKNRIIEIRENNAILKYIYNENDDIINKKYDYGIHNISINNNFNSENQLIKTIIDDLNKDEFNIPIDNIQISYDYDKFGRMKQKNINGRYNIMYDYYSYGKRVSNLVKSVSFNNNEYIYKYDKMGNIIEVKYNDIIIRKYMYDQYGELIEERDFINNVIVNYSYDQYGNLLNKTKKDLNSNDILDIDVFEYNNVEWPDQLTKFNNTLITYDEIGNPITYGDSISMEWINGKELTKYTDLSKNLIVNYSYNLNGIRTTKKYNNITKSFVLDNNDILFEHINIYDDVNYTNENTTISYLYSGKDKIGLVYENNIYYYEKNKHGDIIGILDYDFNKIVTYEYDSWGNILSIKDEFNNLISDSNHIGIINPFRYRGYYYDEETGLYYLNSRYYNPKWCRFINADDLIINDEELLGYNLYVYCYNNPINFCDPNGDLAVVDDLALAGAILAGLLVAAGLLLLPRVLSAVNILFSRINSTLSRALSKSKSGAKAKSKKKATRIYRFGGTSIEKYVPSIEDVSTNSGLSFNKNFRPGSGMTTIEALNATKILRAKNDYGKHVAVKPIGGSIKTWRNQGTRSVWTRTIWALIIKT